MKIFSESNFARASALVSVLVLGALGPQTLYSSSLSAEATRHLLIQGSNVERLVDLVESAGGTVSRELSVLNAVGVEVTPSQLEVISRSADVHRILDDRQVLVETAGNYWKMGSAGSSWPVIIGKMGSADSSWPVIIGKMGSAGSSWPVITGKMGSAGSSWPKRKLNCSGRAMFCSRAVSCDTHFNFLATAVIYN